MPANVRSAEIAEAITDNIPAGDLPQDIQELQALLVHAARLGKIAGLRRARKLTRRGQFYRIGQSIRNTYIALGYDTDAYEQEQVEKHGVYIDSPTLSGEPVDLGTALGFEPFEVPSVTTVYDTPTLTKDLDAPADESPTDQG